MCTIISFSVTFLDLKPPGRITITPALLLGLGCFRACPTRLGPRMASSRYDLRRGPHVFPDVADVQLVKNFQELYDERNSPNDRNAAMRPNTYPPLLVSMSKPAR